MNDANIPVSLYTGPNGCGRLAVMDMGTQSGRDACKGFLDILAGNVRSESSIAYRSTETLDENLNRVDALFSRSAK